MSRKSMDSVQASASIALPCQQDSAVDPAGTETLGSLASVLVPFLRRQADAAQSDTLAAGQATPPGGAQTSEAIPTSIGGYHIIGRLDGGGQADVFRAVHPALQKELVIKLARRVDSGYGFDPQRLVDEGKVLAELSHPHIARIFDLDFHEGQPFLVMEFVRGQNLARYAAAQSLRPREVAALCAKIARGIAKAHCGGVLHRDLKPANVLIDEQGEPRIIDFGLADVRHAWTEPDDRSKGVSGTAPYMPPEQARGELDRVDERSDVFALGAVLYFLLTRKAPFAGENTLDSLARAKECRFDREALRGRHVDRGLARICLKAMSAGPEDRFSTATELAVTLEQFIRRGIHARRIMKAGAVLAPLALVAVLVWSFGPFHERVGPQERAAQVLAPSVASPSDTQAGSVAQTDLEITVGYADGSTSVPLVEALPLKSGNDIQVRWRVPAGHHAALFWLDTVGDLSQLECERLPDATLGRGSFIHPEPGKATTLIGPPGTEVCLVIASKDRPPTLEDLEGLLADGAWPVLASDTAVCFSSESPTVHRIGATRALSGASRSRAEDVQDRADSLRRTLSQQFDAFAGIAFPHVADDATD